MDEKYILKIQENEDRSKSNTRRIDDLESDVKNNNTLALNVRELTVEIKHMREDYQTLAQKHNEEVKVLDSRLSNIENKPANDFEKIKWLIITRYSLGCTGFFIRPSGIIRSDNMKKALEDVKSFVTILFALTLVILLFIAVFKSETIFEMVFLLFTNLCTAVFTYFFSKKKEVMPDVANTKEINVSKSNNSNE